MHLRRVGLSACRNGAAPEGAERLHSSQVRLTVPARPQWSRSRRSGATGTPQAGEQQRQPEPQWSRSRRSGATGHDDLAVRCRPGAAMEPLPKERSDAVTIATAVAHLLRRNGAAPEGAERRDDVVGGAGLAHHAAMEPLPKERSDWGVTAEPHVAIKLPQWSRSRRSGATDATDPVMARCWCRPQWSRSRRSGATRAAIRALARIASTGRNGAAPEGAERPLAYARLLARLSRPQWSRSRRSGATSAGPCRAPERRSAAMEPLPKERSDQHPAARLARGRQRAAMEPLPKERSDCRARGGCSPRTTRRNGAAPEGAERQRRVPPCRRPGQRRNGAAPEGAERPASTPTASSRRSRGRNGAAPEGAERLAGQRQG